MDINEVINFADKYSNDDDSIEYIHHILETYKYKYKKIKTQDEITKYFNSIQINEDNFDILEKTLTSKLKSNMFYSLKKSTWYDIVKHTEELHNLKNTVKFEKMIKDLRNVYIEHTELNFLDDYENTDEYAMCPYLNAINSIDYYDHKYFYDYSGDVTVEIKYVIYDVNVYLHYNKYECRLHVGEYFFHGNCCYPEKMNFKNTHDKLTELFNKKDVHFFIIHEIISTTIYWCNKELNDAY